MDMPWPLGTRPKGEWRRLYCAFVAFHCRPRSKHTEVIQDAELEAHGAQSSARGLTSKTKLHGLHRPMNFLVRESDKARQHNGSPSASELHSKFALCFECQFPAGGKSARQSRVNEGIVRLEVIMLYTVSSTLQSISFAVQATADNWQDASSVRRS